MQSQDLLLPPPIIISHSRMSFELQAAELLHTAGLLPGQNIRILSLPPIIFFDPSFDITSLFNFKLLIDFFSLFEILNC